MNKRTKVTQQLHSAMQPVLTAAGFSRVAGVNSYRDHDKTIDVLKVEFFDNSTHRTWGTTTHSFGISCGVYLKFAPNPFGGRIPTDAKGHLEPDAAVCTLRSHLVRTLSQPKHVPDNVWFVDAELSNLDAVCNDVARLVQSVALSWFDRFASLAAILEVLQSADEEMKGGAPCFGFGRKGSPVRNLYLGFAALESGRPDIAQSALTDAMGKGGFARLSGSTEVDEQIKKTIDRLTKRAM